MSALMPLIDVTNQTNIQRTDASLKSVNARAIVSEPVLTRPSTATQPAVYAPASVRRYRHEPYLWQYLVEQPTEVSAPPPTTTAVDDSATVCVALIQHKCHVTECVSPFQLGAGQYVVIRGDRGVDVGVVVKVSASSTTVSTPPSVGVLRYATQQEVDFWATDLKAMEAAALDFCRQRVQRHKLPMEVRHAEYQYDQKKLTFYFDARQRVDFVVVLRELYREFGCRIWMEKV